MHRWWPIVVAAGLVLAALDRPGWAAEEKAPAKKAAAVKKPDAPKKTEAGQKVALTRPAVCAMQEVPAFGKEEGEGRTQFRYPRGPFARCSPEPSKQVKAYPKLKSQRPLYGSLTLDGSPFDPSAGKTYFFVLDESGSEQRRTEREKGQGMKETAKKAAAGANPFAPDPPASTRPAGDEGKYDRLYFDLNGDRDLTNDPVLELAKESPFKGLPGPGQGVFQDLKLPIDYGPPHGTRPFRIVPWLAAVSGDRAVLCFAPAVARRGKIRLGGQEYTAHLSQSAVLSGRFDRPFVDLGLVPVDRAARVPIRIRPGTLGEIRQVDGQYVTVSATPLGDKLTIQPYSGGVGVLEVGPGGRTITELGLIGSLVSKTGSLLVGESTPLPPEILQRRHTLPVGDYFPSSLTIQYGRLRFNSRVLTDLTPRSGDQPDKGPDFGIKIRKDKPFVLEFSGKPAVKFMTPTEGQSFKPGQPVMIRAMLTEPFQGIMITGLWDSTHKTGERRYQSGGKEVTVPEFARLDPTIVIRDSQGKQVAEGKMPFG